MDSALTVMLTGEVDELWSIADTDIRWGVEKLLAAAARDLAAVTAC